MVKDNFRLIKAEKEDFDEIVSFYKFVIDNTETMPQYCRWVYGLHPSDELILHYIEEGAMYYTRVNNEILSAVVVLPYQEEDYHNIDWGITLADDEVAALHILCVNPAYQKQGVAKRTMDLVASLAGSLNKKAVRLDTLKSNLTAQHMYETFGYTRIAVKNWYACNTGWTDFVLYEKILSQ